MGAMSSTDPFLQGDREGMRWGGGGMEEGSINPCSWDRRVCPDSAPFKPSIPHLWAPVAHARTHPSMGGTSWAIKGMQI